MWRKTFLLVAVLARVAGAQVLDTARHPSGTTVRGVVHDSIAHAPLGGAMVQLVPAEGSAHEGHAAVTDSLGHFELAGIAAGRYLLGFFHPMLDSLGVAPSPREVHVRDDNPVIADLAIPSPARLRGAICSVLAGTDSGGVLVGSVHDARDGAPMAGVTVTVEWLEFTFQAQHHVVRRIPRLVATTRENGWFALCNVPSGGTLAMIAARGADSTDRIDVEVPVEGFLRRELYLGSSRTIAVGDTMPRDDTLALSPRRKRVGEGRLSGTVVAGPQRQPLVDAQVSFVGGPQTRTNERGEWTLVDAPTGTRMLEVRALGYYPSRRRVDVVTDAPPVHVALSTLKAVLDTVRVTAAYRRARDLDAFEQRRRTSVGHFITAEDIARRHLFDTSKLFHMISGTRLMRNAGDPDTYIQMRGGDGWCEPNFYLDGMPLNHLTVDELDTWIRPEKIAGIEIYSEGAVPAQYQIAMDGCGSIVIWSK